MEMKKCFKQYFKNKHLIFGRDFAIYTSVQNTF